MRPFLRSRSHLSPCVRTAAFAAADRSVSFAAAAALPQPYFLSARDSEACGAVQPEGICLSVGPSVWRRSH